jgi:pyruvate formate lyase activating enzyme
MPLIRGMNDSIDTIHRTMEFLQPYNHYQNFQGIDLLPYHKLGINKYKQLDMRYAITKDLGFKEEELEHIAEAIKDYDLQAKIVKH